MNVNSLIPQRRPRWGVPVMLGAAGLAASFLYVQAKKRTVERANPPAGKFVEVDGIRLHYLERGSGPALVLLHGNGLLAHDFELSGLMERASENYHVIAFDRPGFGHSERPAGTSWTPEAQARLIYQALHALHIERPIVLGHSWGTLVALAMALDYPKYVRAIALVSGYFYPSVRIDVQLASVPAIPLFGPVWRNTLAPLMGRMMWPALVKRMFGPASTPERFDRLPVWMTLRPSQLRASAAESAMMVPSADRLSRRYRGLTLPVAVIAGSEDLIASSRHNAVKLHEEISHSDLVLQPGVGHMAHYSDPAGVMATVDKLQAKATPSIPA